MFQLMNSSEGYLARLYRFIQPHVIVYSLPTVRGTRGFRLTKGKFLWEVGNCQYSGLVRNYIGEEFFIVVPIIAANSLPWVEQGCLRSNLSAGKLACVTGLSTVLPLCT